ncbi:HEPN domain-containing protein [Neomoorella mulderi]|uniref:Uncharacterized protein n=1 Tax=Moorella mulderi DSM 14980 TaxID=1122241 RepID=A0A151AY34_9FIRM|nr:HEPN domain-containing protein [Moorella mulderi]KYH32463.1 hypothetical protein MOMUL_10640 [Moorella mulderi DSM 14980]
MKLVGHRTFPAQINTWIVPARETACTKTDIAEEAETVPEDIKNLVKEVIEYTCRGFEGRPLPLRPWYRVLRTGDGGATFPLEMRPDSELVAIELMEAINALPAVKYLHKVARARPEISASLLTDAAGKSIHDERDAERWLTSRFLVPVIGVYLRQAGAFVYDDNLAERVALQAAREAALPVVDFTLVAPLLNASMKSVQQVEFTSDLILRPVSEEELESWLNDNQAFLPGDLPVPFYQLIAIECCVEARYSQQKSEPIGQTDAQARTDGVITALRLTSGRNVCAPFFQTTVHRISYPLRSYRSQRAGVCLPDQPAVIDEALTERLRGLWQRMTGSPNAGKVRLALSRWNNSFERRSPADRLIDYWIALESLLTADSSQEVTFRAALRTAALLGGSGTEKLEIYKQMKKSYKVRSDIVHGRPIEEKKIWEQAAQTQEHLRQILLKLLESDQPIDPTAAEEWLLAEA